MLVTGPPYVAPLKLADVPESKTGKLLRLADVFFVRSTSTLYTRCQPPEEPTLCAVTFCAEKVARCATAATQTNNWLIIVFVKSDIATYSVIGKSQDVPGIRRAGKGYSPASTTTDQPGAACP